MIQDRRGGRRHGEVRNGKHGEGRALRGGGRPHRSHGCHAARWRDDDRCEAGRTGLDAADREDRFGPSAHMQDDSAPWFAADAGSWPQSMDIGEGSADRHRALGAGRKQDLRCDRRAAVRSGRGLIRGERGATTPATHIVSDDKNMITGRLTGLGIRAILNPPRASTIAAAGEFISNDRRRRRRIHGCVAVGFDHRRTGHDPVDRTARIHLQRRIRADRGHHQTSGHRDRHGPGDGRPERDLRPRRHRGDDHRASRLRHRTGHDRRVQFASGLPLGRRRR